MNLWELLEEKSEKQETSRNNINLQNADCLKVMEETEQENIYDVAFTSPPYNRKRNDKYQMYDDTINDYYEFLCKFTNELLRLTKKYIIINVQKNYYNKKDVFKYIGTYSDKIADIVIWEKSNPLPASGNSITNAYEFFIIMAKEPLKANTTYIKNHITTSVNSDMPKEHKAVMKQEVSDWFIEHFTSVGDVVIDPFMGLGTTGISCIKYNRGFVGIEICEEYYKTARERLMQKDNKDVIE